MGAEVLIVKCLQMGGVAIISALVESGLESMGKPEWASALKTVTFAGIALVAVGAVWELFNYAGSVFL